MDRNLPIILSTVSVISSLSARRAWIEINDSLDSILAGVSLSARRAWIEIQAILVKVVDLPGRSPQGERG